MKKFLIIALSILLAISLAACDDQPTPDVETSPATETQGESMAEVKYIPLEITHELGQNYLLKYVYRYNESWVQTGVTTYLNGEFDSETVYELDPQTDQIVKLTSTGADGEVVEMDHKNTYDDQGNLISQDVYSEDILDSHITFTYDENGNRLSQKAQNYSTGTVYTTTYDASGNILRNEIKMDARGNIPASHSWTEYTYDENGNEIKAVTCYDTAEDNTTVLTEYDAQGRKLRSTSTKTSGGESTLTETREFTYGDNKETETVFDGNGNLLMTVTRTYDDAGNLLSSETVSDHSTNRTTYTYQKVELPAN